MLLKLSSRWVVWLAVALASAGGAAEHVTGTNLWQATINFQAIASPAVGANGAIYMSTWDGRLLAFNPDGSRRWVFVARREMYSSPAIAEDGSILVGCRDRQLYAVAADGKKRWAFKTGGWVDASAAVAANGTIYFGSWDRKFYALSPAGRKQWEFITGGPVVSSAAIDLQGTIYVGSHDGRLYALNPDGTQRWAFATQGQIISSPAIAANGDIIFTSLDGRLYAVDANGQQRWSLHTGGVTAASPALGLDGTIHLGVNSNYCMITAEGKMKWKGGLSPTGYMPPDWIASTPAVLEGGLFIVTGTDGAMVVLMPDGDWTWNYWLEGPSRSSVCIGPDAMIYAASTGGKLYAFRNSIPLANSSWPMFRADPQHTGRARPVR